MPNYNSTIKYTNGTTNKDKKKNTPQASTTAYNIGGVAQTNSKYSGTSTSTSNNNTSNYGNSTYNTNTTGNKNTKNIASNTKNNKNNNNNNNNNNNKNNITDTYTTALPQTVVVDPEEYATEEGYLSALYDAGQYDSQYESTISSLLNQILNPTDFNIQNNADYNQLYNLYKQNYQNNARLAAQNAMAEGAALTGGYGNSVAQIASQQAYDNQMNNLNNQAIDLYQLAYNQYLNDRSDKYSQLESVLGVDDAYATRFYNDRDYATQQDNTAWDRYGEAYKMAQDYASNGLSIPDTYASILGSGTTNALNQLAAQVVAKRNASGGGSNPINDETRYQESTESQIQNLMSGNVTANNNHQAATILLDAYESGAISESQANAIAKKYGVDLSDKTYNAMNEIYSSATNRYNRSVRTK